MTEALIVAPLVTPDQLDLIRRTVANGATGDELKLYLYDCARQGVHPLDKLLHFTKRGGKYTPVTSIDLMRTRAADTGEYAGSDDADFHDSEPGDDPPGFLASVTVWRLVQGQRCAFTATARWEEYFPGEQSGHMWKKMPHTMLGKCAEALALRKGFPRQLAGLYAKEELDQANGESRAAYTVDAPAAHSAERTPEEIRENAPTPSAGDSGRSPLPAGAVRLLKVEAGANGMKAKAFIQHSGQAGGADGLPLYDAKLALLAEQCCQDGMPVQLEVVLSKASGKPYIKRLWTIKPEDVTVQTDPVDAEEIPF